MWNDWEDVDVGAGEEVIVGRGDAVFAGDDVGVGDDERDDLDDAAVDEDLVSQGAGPITCDAKTIEMRVRASTCDVAA